MYIEIGVIDTRYLYLQNKTNKKLIAFDEKGNEGLLQNRVKFHETTADGSSSAYRTLESYT